MLAKEKQWRENPDPGAYDHEKNRSGVFTQKKNSKTKNTWSKTKRKGIEFSSGKDKDLILESPGPENYHLPPLMGEMPSYSLPKIASKTTTALVSPNNQDIIPSREGSEIRESRTRSLS